MDLKDSGLLKSQCYINGRWVAADNGGFRPIRHPATGAVGSRYGINEYIDLKYLCMGDTAQ
jgi:hypothetical protein